MKQFNLDGYTSAVVGHRQAGMNIRSVTAPFLYATGGLFAKVIDKPAELAASGAECSDRGISIVLEQLSASKHITDAVRWSLLSGGAVVAPIINDGRGLEEEINYGNIREVEELRVYGVDDVAVFGNKYSDATKKNYGKPQFYEIKSDFIVHESRVIPIAGDPIPNATQTGIYWHGRSIADTAYKDIMDYRQALANASNILQRKQQAIYEMAGLAELIAAEMEKDVQTRINLVDQARGILNTVAVDAEDKYRISDSSLGGVADVINEMQIQLSADTGIPINILFGKSAKGLNNSGESDLRNWHDLIDGIRETKVKPALERLASLIAAQKGVTAGDDWEIEFPSLFKPTATEQAAIDKTNAEALRIELEAAKAAFELGAITEEDLTKHLADKGYFGLTNETDGADYAEKTA